MEENSNIVLFERFMRGETSSDEELQLIEWFHCPTGREQLMNYYYQIWLASDKEVPAEVQGRMFEQIKSRLHEEQKEQGQQKRKRILPFRRLCEYAAILLLMVGVAIAEHQYTFHYQKNKTASEYLVSTEKGQRANVILPDGTKVWLNSYTKLSYHTNYGSDKRIVSLTGEAFFEVAKDKERPFIVKTEGMEVEALGTTFNVKAYDEDSQIVATLFSGSVRVSAGGHNTILSPNQDATWERGTKRLAVHKLENSDYAKMWRDNELVFNGETLDEIAILLNRIYNVQIVFNSDDIRKFRFTGVICNNSLDNVIELISLTSPITYKTRGDTIELNNR